MKMMERVLGCLLCLLTVLSMCTLFSAADGTHGFYSECDLKSVDNKADAFMIDFRSDSAEGICTYWANANWNMYTRSAKTKEKYKSLTGGGAYSGLQILDNTNQRRSVMSFWAWEYKEGRKTKKLYSNVMMGTSATNDNEGSATSCVMPYNWKSGAWYRQMIYCWTDIETGETMCGDWYYDYDADRWDLFVYYNTHLYDSYISSGVSQFQENFSEYARETVRSFCYRNIYFLNHETGEWVSAPKIRLWSDGNPKAIGEVTMGVSDDGTYIWASVDGKSEVDSDDRRELYPTLKQAEKPENIGSPEIGDITVKAGEQSTRISWEMAEHSTPQLIYEISVEDADGNTVYQNKQSRPHIQKLDVEGLTSDEVKVTLSVTDPFGGSTAKTYETESYTAAKNAPAETSEGTSGLTSAQEPAAESGINIVTLTVCIAVGAVLIAVVIAAVIVIVVVTKKKKA